MKRIRVGIIGQGRSGYGIHAHVLKQMPEDYEIAAVTDSLPERCDRAVAEFGCDAYLDRKEMLGRTDLDLIVNATPSQMHAPVTMEFLSAGFNVLCEKPLAVHTTDTDALISMARDKGKLLTVFHQHRFSPYFRQIKKVIASGVLGRIVMFKIYSNNFSRRWDWQALQECCGGNLLNTGTHMLDLALQIFGTDTMPDITCLMDRANTFGDADDHVKVLMHKDGHPAIDFEVSSCCAYPGAAYQIYAEHGGLSGNSDHIEWKYFKPEEAPEQHLTKAPIDGYCSESIKWYTEAWNLNEDLFVWDNQMKKDFYASLAGSLIDGNPLEVTLGHIAQQVAVIEKCRNICELK